MEVYFDQELDIGSSSVRHSASEWHLTYDLLGVASFYNNEEGFLCIYNGQVRLSALYFVWSDFCWVG